MKTHEETYESIIDRVANHHHLGNLLEDERIITAITEMMREAAKRELAWDEIVPEKTQNGKYLCLVDSEVQYGRLCNDGAGNVRFYSDFITYNATHYFDPSKLMKND